MDASYPGPTAGHNSGLGLQKYMVLHSEHQTLRENLDQLRSPFGRTTVPFSGNSAASSPSTPLSPGSFGAGTPTTSYFPAAPSVRGGSGGGGSGSSSSSSNGSRRRPSGPSRESSCYNTRCRGTRLETVVDERTLCREAVDDERRLWDVNECMKRTLTEMLNCDDARSDSKFRMWVQCRLMETERELRVERRRRSCFGMTS